MTARLFVTAKISDGSVRSPNEDKLKKWRDKSVSRQQLIRIDCQLRAVPATCGLAISFLVIAGLTVEFSAPVLFAIILFFIVGAVCFWLDSSD